MTRSALVAEILVRTLLFVAFALISVGALIIYVPTGLIVTGLALAAWTWISFVGDK